MNKLYFCLFVIIFVCLLIIVSFVKKVFKVRLINKLEKMSTGKEVYSVISYK